MMKLTFTLAAALYAGFVVWGEPSDVADTREVPTPVFASVVPTQGEGFERPTILGSSRGEATVTRASVDPTPDIVVPDPAEVARSAPAPSALQPTLIGEPVIVSLVAPAGSVTTETSVDPDAELLRVTGSRVNMRSGPSTANGVVDSLPRGTLAEAIGDPVNGWQEIRDVATGRTGFMASRFLEPS